MLKQYPCYLIRISSGITVPLVTSIKAIEVYMPGIGKVKLAIVKNGYSATIQNTRFIITDMLDTPAQDILKKYLSRWDIECFFRDIKQHLNFEKSKHVILKN